jgi:hypothetical protein
MTQIRVIRPYKYFGTWVFDDETTGLEHEAFVAGADTMIDLATEDIPNAEKGFVMLFSADPFPGYQVHLEWLREDMEGNVYLWKDKKVEGWLCPALFKYFETAPKNIYVLAKQISK